MNLFKLRFGSSEKAWAEWRNEQFEDLTVDTIQQLGATAMRPDPLPYGCSSEMIAIPQRPDPVDLLSHGI